jgi:hypothetical protein
VQSIQFTGDPRPLRSPLRQIPRRRSATASDHSAKSNHLSRGTAAHPRRSSAHRLNHHSLRASRGVGSDGGPTGDWTFLDDDPPGNPSAVVVQDWVCLEWLHDGANNETKFWWDATEHPSLATTAESHGGNQDADYLMPQFESMWVGWWLYQGGPNPDHYDVWIDEVAVDSVRIGCIL